MLLYLSLSLWIHSLPVPVCVYSPMSLSLWIPSLPVPVCVDLPVCIPLWSLFPVEFGNSFLTQSGWHPDRGWGQRIPAHSWLGPWGHQRPPVSVSARPETSQHNSRSISTCLESSSLDGQCSITCFFSPLFFSTWINKMSCWYTLSRVGV